MFPPESCRAAHIIRSKQHTETRNNFHTEPQAFRKPHVLACMKHVMNLPFFFLNGEILPRRTQTTENQVGLALTELM